MRLDSNPELAEEYDSNYTEHIPGKLHVEWIVYDPETGKELTAKEAKDNNLEGHHVANEITNNRIK
jgi:hypothetical protein